MKELLPYLIVDLALVVSIIVLFARHLTFFHPLFYYGFFHVYSVTVRGWQLYGGAYPMYYRIRSAAYYSAIVPAEFVRGIIVADLALLLFAIGAGMGLLRLRSRTPRDFNDSLLMWTVGVLLPIGTALLIVRRFSTSGAEIVHGFQLWNIMSIWPIACLGLAIARWGFRWFLVAGSIAYILVVGLQGYHRFMALLPLILLVGLYLARNRRAWPGPAAIALLIVAIVVFPDLKEFGRTFNQSGLGAAVQQIGATADDDDPARGSKNEMFFDQFAGALTAADTAPKPLFGQTYLAVLALPIPRALWPDKPSLGESALSVAAPGRPFDKEGRIVTLTGESYINFRYVGILIIFPALGLLLTMYYRKAFSTSAVDSYKLGYIALCTSFLQVFRDGLPSFILFSFLAMAPIYIYILGEKLSRGKEVHTAHAGPVGANERA